jgi:hypothetical protein
MKNKAVKFFRYAGVWRYKEIGKDVSDGVDTRALENILGVMGGPLVYVCRDTGKPELTKLRIEVRNGFIVRASVAEDDNVSFAEGTEVDEFYIRPLMN